MDLEPGEQVFFHGHPSWRSMLAFYVRGLLAAIIAGVIAGLITRASNGGVEVGWVAPAVLVVFVIVLIWGLLRRLVTTYTITDRRLTITIGLLSREMHETRLERVQNVRTRQGLLERVVGVGTVDFDTAAGAAYDFSFRGVDDPGQIVRTVNAALEDIGLTHPHV
ncbi:MAG: PH domain-containing protein [Solirubrobacterales bacterium]|nr:PH domain-containing protein [Solirubrobacterales bacterium]